MNNPSEDEKKTKDPVPGQTCAWTDPQRNNFKFLRLFAALLVIFGHSYGIADPSLDPIYRLSNGQFTSSFLGLSVFFFLSGFLVSQSFFNSRSLVNFIWRRIIRIYPAACLSILLAAILMGPLVTNLSVPAYFRDPLLRDYLSSCILVRIHYFLPGVFTQSAMGAFVNRSLWTISLELKLYLALLLLLAVPLPRKTWIICCAAVGLTAGGLLFPGFLKQLLHPQGAGGFTLMSYTVFTPFFLTGMAVFMLKDKIRLNRFLTGGALALMSTSLLFHFFAWVQLLVLPIFILYFSTFRVSFFKRITPRYDLSYGLYVFAFPAQQCVLNYLHPSTNLLFFFLSLICTLPIAIISWELVEKKCLSLKNLVK